MYEWRRLKGLLLLRKKRSTTNEFIWQNKRRFQSNGLIFKTNLEEWNRCFQSQIIMLFLRRKFWLYRIFHLKQQALKRGRFQFYQNYSDLWDRCAVMHFPNNMTDNFSTWKSVWIDVLRCTCRTIRHIIPVHGSSFHSPFSVHSLLRHVWFQKRFSILSLWTFKHFETILIFFFSEWTKW